MNVKILVGDVRTMLATIPDESIHTCITSPPYFGLRDYGADGQIGLEQTPDQYVGKLVAVFREVRRVLRDDGTLWLNLGDSYAGAGYSNHHNTGGALKSEGGKQRHLTGTGAKPKDLLGIPWRVAFALQADGWYLRQDIIWSKPNPMPESVRDRCTKSHEYIFLMSKSKRYYFDADAIAEEAAWERWGDQKNTKALVGAANLAPNRTKEELQKIGGGKRNKRSVWTVTTQPFKEAHFATFPPALIEPCILAGCPDGGTVLDPFFGAGTTGLVADRHGRNAIGIELNPGYAEMAKKRINGDSPLFAEVTR